MPGTDLPVENNMGEWIAFGDRQTGQLDKANDRYTAATGIVSRCEERDRAAVQAADKRWWQFWK